MAKLKEYVNHDDANPERNLWFFCPGCKTMHPFRVGSTDPGRPNWEWNGSFDSPTFEPSLLVNGHYPELRCHSYVVDGKIRFLDDCHHNLAGVTIELPDAEE